MLYLISHGSHEISRTVVYKSMYLIICVHHIQLSILQNALLYYPRFGLCQKPMTNGEKSHLLLFQKWSPISLFSPFSLPLLLLLLTTIQASWWPITLLVSSCNQFYLLKPECSFKSTDMIMYISQRAFLTFLLKSSTALCLLLLSIVSEYMNVELYRFIYFSLNMCL